MKQWKSKFNAFTFYFLKEEFDFLKEIKNFLEEINNFLKENRFCTPYKNIYRL